MFSLQTPSQLTWECIAAFKCGVIYQVHQSPSEPARLVVFTPSQCVCVTFCFSSQPFVIVPPFFPVPHLLIGPCLFILFFSYSFSVYSVSLHQSFVPCLPACVPRFCTLFSFCNFWTSVTLRSASRSAFAVFCCQLFVDCLLYLHFWIWDFLVVGHLPHHNAPFLCCHCHLPASVCLEFGSSLHDICTDAVS